MEKLHAFALRHIIVNVDTLIDLLSQLDDAESDRIVEALCGINNPAEIEAQLPKIGNLHNNKDLSICIFESYNYVQDKVKYRYISRDYRRFKTEEAAKKFQDTGDYSYGTSECNQTPTETHPFIAYRDRMCVSSCDSSRWIRDIREHEKLENQSFLDVEIG